MVNRGVDHLCSDSIWRLIVDSEQSYALQGRQYTPCHVEDIISSRRLMLCCPRTSRWYILLTQQIFSH